MNAYRNYNTNTKALSGNLEKLSSGYKINRAGDDAAGLAISEKMRAQITGLDAAQKNVKDGVSLVKTAEGAMQEIQDMLNRMDYLATQSANGTYDNEVDRKNLQKEVDALKSEINRIADSANFNGINLLDGKVGFNKDAFTVSDVAAQGKVDGSNLLSNANFTATSANGVHETVAGNTTQTTVSFSLDLGSLKVDATSVAAGATATLKVNFAGTSITLNLASNGGSSSDGQWTAEDIASALADAFNSVTVGNAASGGNYLEGIGFEAAATGSKVTFTFVGTGTAGATITEGGKYTPDQADAINGYFGSAVTVSLGTSGGEIVDDRYLHGIKFDETAKAEQPPKNAGIDFKLTSDIVSDNNKLTIDGTTFVFKTTADSTVTANSANNEVLIDVSEFGADDQIKEAIKQMVQQEIKSSAKDKDKVPSRFDITATGEDKIHIDQKNVSSDLADPNTEDGKLHLFTEEDLKKLFSASGPDKAPVNAGTKIEINAGKLASGNKISVGGKDYQFTDSATNETKPTDDNATRMVGGGPNGANAVDNLKAALEADGFQVEKDVNGALIVRNQAAGAAAPVVGGSGLTLQIGDTSDSFNQLSVKIGDMHTKAMGTEGGKSIADIDISSQGGAQEAVQTIKDAINYVSGVRGDLGAVQNRLEHTGNNLSVMAENIQDAESTIRDTDVASEMMSYVKNNILVQSAQAMLAQANQVPQGVLQLLG